MTIINRICPELSDIIAIRLECNHCHATVSYSPANWKPRFLKCPNCTVTLVDGSANNLTDELRGLSELAEGIQALLNLKQPEFRLRIEFAQC